MKIEIQNLKCGGCATTIKNALNKIPKTEVVEIDINTNTIEIALGIDANQELILKVLTRLGYPPIGAKNTFGNKTSSYISCMIGSVK